MADFGTREDAVATLAASRAWAAAQLDVFAEAAQDYTAGNLLARPTTAAESADI